MKQRTSCALCGSGAKLRVVYSERVRHAPPFADFLAADKFPVEIRGVVCLRCGWVFKRDVFDDDELARLYGATSGEAPGRRATDPVIADHRSRAVYEFVQPHFAPGPRRILDVGGRGGELMGAFVAAGHKVTSLDLGPPPDTALPGVNVIQGDFVQWSSRTCDVIIMSHVLEHTDDPSAFLRHAHVLLSEGGLVFVEVPFELLTPLVVRHVGDHRHLVYFTRATLGAFLEKSGFEVLRCEHVTDVVSTRIPLLRAVGRKSRVRPWSPSPLAALLSCAEVLRPQSLATRIRSRVRFGRTHA